LLLASEMTCTDNGGVPPDWSDAVRAELHARTGAKRGLRYLIASAHVLLAFAIFQVFADLLYSIFPRGIKLTHYPTAC
jgi:hypothetical protein